MIGSVFTPAPTVKSIEIGIGRMPSAVSFARRLTREWFRHWGLPDHVIERGELVVSELVTNSVTKSTGSTIFLRVRWPGPSGFIEVWDADPAPPVMRQADAADTGGRGLLLVSGYSHRWGYYLSAGGKVVWAEVTLRHGNA